MSAYGQGGQAVCRYEHQRAASARWATLRPLGHAEFPATPCTVAAVRAWARHLLAGRTPGPVLDDVTLLLSEVVTNAVVHSDSGRTPGGSVTVCLGLGGGMVHAEVIDDGSPGSIPFLRATGADSESGRGLHLVEAIAARWGAHHGVGTGNAVWFRVAGLRTA
ncbi:anti-sigma regulatory factor (Ser/Thr protein kinase) [Streptosporangium becharense]|uniref:Anti-sigma regulatory factor (Ser/Thr protein kinase) n=1 Tax=Streptosporangium becharense TaxID=1816182 RepID=A0A7W9IH42_9ACTN|nr:ATP-binding protein [Streptosporangium becharense]MBB2909028.1 anti-sigma regulatory factor (Ser/Thr protein kinase) [Streptosporangium becharense]MBB5819954.1 anti-sigma regulatory factor (Ser/Thr protein kinase) [Streptosporangium becharense]